MKVHQRYKEYLENDKINGIDNGIDNYDSCKSNKIADIVAMYSMGYDNKDIDFLIFKDPKLSHKDIIQSIGRGTRPDELGNDKRNLKK